jgi:glycosyltransferase involved in cell wall biosynthesis
MLSIIIPVYNGEKFIKEAIRSCITSRLSEDYEIIIVDDGSSDSTQEQIKEFKGIENIKIFKQPNLGSAAARNNGIYQSRGQFISFLDSDDIYLKGTVDYFLNYLSSAQDNKKCFYCDYVRLTDKGLFESYVQVRELLPTPFKYRQFLLPKMFPILTSTVLISKTVLIEVGGFDERFLRCQDLELWTRIIERFDIEKLNIYSSGRRMHKDQVTKNRSEIIFWREEVNISFLNRVDFKNFCTSPDEHTQAKTAEYFGDVMFNAPEPLYKTAKWLYDFSSNLLPNDNFIRKKAELKKQQSHLNIRHLE